VSQVSVIKNVTLVAELGVGIDDSRTPVGDVAQTGDLAGVSQQPWRQEVPDDELAERLGPVVARETVALGDGRLAVVVPAGATWRLGVVHTNELPSALARLARGADGKVT
jgi:hypothetical protein